MENVRSTDDVFITPPTTRYLTPDEYLNGERPSLPVVPRTYWASDRGFQVGERRGRRRPSEGSDASELDEYLCDESVLAKIERVEESHVPLIRPTIPELNHSPSPAFKEEPDFPESRSSASFHEVIFPSIETEELATLLSSPTTNEYEFSPPVSPTPNHPAGGFPRLSIASTDTRIIEDAQPRDEQDGILPAEFRPIEPSPPASATQEVTETAKVTSCRDLAYGMREGEVSVYLEWVAKLGRHMVDQKEGDTPRYHIFNPAFYTSLKKNSAKAPKTGQAKPTSTDRPYSRSSNSSYPC